MPDAVLVARDFLERPSARDAQRLVFDDVDLRRRPRELVVLLDQEPGLAVLVAIFVAVTSYERPAAAQLLALERELELAFLVAGLGILFRMPRPAIPQQHGARAVLLWRYDAL